MKTNPIYSVTAGEWTQRVKSIGCRNLRAEVANIIWWHFCADRKPAPELRAMARRWSGRSCTAHSVEAALVRIGLDEGRARYLAWINGEDPGAGRYHGVYREVDMLSMLRKAVA